VSFLLILECLLQPFEDTPLAYLCQHGLFGVFGAFRNVPRYYH
jgi:hypothetical protein